MSRLLLHIGMPKTGTSSLQNFLAVNDAALRRCGIFYPTDMRSFNLHDYRHHAEQGDITSGNGEYLYFSVFEPARNLTRGTIDDYFSYCAATDLPSTLISTELLWWYFPEFLSHCGEAIRRHFSECQVIVFKKDIVDLSIDGYLQDIKGMIPETTFDSYLKWKRWDMNESSLQFTEELGDKNDFFSACVVPYRPGATIDRFLQLYLSDLNSVDLVRSCDANVSDPEDKLKKIARLNDGASLNDLRAMAAAHFEKASGAA